jgi:drug/metabolite transporter (DMT)-like permease
MSTVSALPAPPSNLPRAIISMTLAILLFSSMNAMIKLLSSHYPLSQIIFARAFFSLLVISPMIAAAGGWRSLGTSRPWGHVWRCGAGVAAMTCGFTAITLLPLANAAAIGFTTPLFITFLGIFMLGERIRWRRTLALLTGFAGVLIMLTPSLQANLKDGVAGFGLGSLIGLAGAAMAAMAMISIRRLSSTELSTTIVFYFMLTGTLISALFLPFQFIMPDLKGGLMLVGIGLVGGIAQILLTQAYRQAPVAVIAPFDYTAMLWATGWGYLIWGDLPTSLTLVGAAIVIASGVYITYRELHLGVTKTPTTKVRGELP